MIHVLVSNLVSIVVVGSGDGCWGDESTVVIGGHGWWIGWGVCGFGLVVGGCWWKIDWDVRSDFVEIACVVGDVSSGTVSRNFVWFGLGDFRFC